MNMNEFVLMYIFSIFTDFSDEEIEGKTTFYALFTYLVFFFFFFSSLTYENLR